MRHDPESIITEDEIMVERTPEELIRWVQEKCHKIASSNLYKEDALLHKSIFKKFYEEVYPLALFVTHLYVGRTDVRCLPNLAKKDDFDAIIFDYSLSPPSILKIEITSAYINHGEVMRMKYLIKNGSVNLWGKVSKVGTEKTGHKIDVANEAIKHNDHLQQTLSLIEKAAKRKIYNPTKYGNDHVLVIVFDDCLWFTSNDALVLKSFIKEKVLIPPLRFKAVYVLGLSGKTFCGQNMGSNPNYTLYE